MAGRPREFDKDAALEKALLVFQAKGYEGASLDDLCSAMQIRRPSLYKAYGNKEKLFLQALDVYGLSFEQKVELILNSEADGKLALNKLLDWLGEVHMRDDVPVGCLIVNSGIICNGEHPNISEKIAGQHELREQMLLRRLLRAQEDGQLQPHSNPQAVAQFINGVLVGMAVLARGQAKKEVIYNIIAHTKLALDQL